MPGSSALAPPPSTLVRLRGRAACGLRRPGMLGRQPGGELWIGFGDLVADAAADEREHLRIRSRRGRHQRWPVEVEAGVRDDLLDRVPRMDALEREALARAVKGEEPAPGEELPRAAWPVDPWRTGTGRGDEVDLRHEDARRVLFAEEDHLRHKEV